MIILWIIISIIFLTSRSLEVEIRPYSGKRPHEAHDRIVGYKKNIPNAGLKSDQSNQTSIIKEPLNKEISNKESIPNEKFKSYQQNRTADEDTKDEKINRKESITLEGIEAILGNQTLDNATLNLEIHNERSPNKEFKLKSTNQTFFNALNEEMGKKRKVRSIFYIPEPRKRKPSKPNNKALNKRKSKSNKPLPVKKKADHEKQKQIISTTAKPSNQTLDKNILNKGMNNTKNTTTRGTETDQRYKLLGYDALNGAVGNKKCIKWGTIPSTGLLSDYFIYVGAYIHPRPSREYVAFFDGILLQNNVALTNVMFNS